MSGATVDLGNIKFNWKGPWTNSTAYVVNDTVFSSPHGYVCITAHTSHASDANLATSDSAYWNQMTAGSTTGLPDQTGQAGEYLKTDGATATWEAIVSDPTMGGDLTGTASNAQIAANAVTASEIAAGAVGTSEIAANAVTLAEMAGLTRGSVIVGDASGDPSALTKGTADQVLTSDGTDLSWATAAGGGGKVLQVIHAQNVGPDTSTSSTSFVNTSTTAQITCSATTSKVLIMFAGAGYGYRNNDGNQYFPEYQLYETATTTAFPGGSQTRFIRGTGFQPNAGSSNRIAGACVGTVLHSPSSTAQLTYTVQIMNEYNSVAWCETASEAATITLMEIGV